MNTRLQHLQDICQQAQVDGFLISSTSNIFYLSGFNRFLVDHDGYLLVTRKNHYLITSPLYTHAVKKFTPELAVLETSPDVWYSQMIKKIVVNEGLQIIGFEEQDLRVSEFFDLQDEKVQLKSVSLRNLRVQKDTEEISNVQKACTLTDQTFEHILSFIKEGVTELQLSEEMEHFVKSQGAEIGFPSIVAFGVHSAVPHHMTSDEKLTKNSFVLFDFGIKYKSYLSDMSRTVFFGQPTDEQKNLYETVKKSQEKAIEYIESVILGAGRNEVKEAASLRSQEGVMPESNQDAGQASMTIPDIFVKDVDALSRDVIEKAGFPAYPHALGHGIGLEVHEAPTLSKYSPEKLIDGMVFTLEPGIYVPELGGVRIEDMFVIQNKKLKQLTHAAKELIVLE